MNIPPAGPSPTDWMAAVVRSLHPVRWVACLAGLALTGLILPLAEPMFNGAAPQWAGWWADPIGQARALATVVADRSLGAVVVRVGPLIALLAAAWCLVGGWVARHELLARHRARPGAMGLAPEPGPTGLVARKAKDLVLGPVLALLLGAIAILPVLIAGRVNDWLGGPGAILVALLLPLVLIANLVLLLVALGWLAWPLMPITVAAENSDAFDGLSRAYNYAFMRPVRFVLLTACAVFLGGIPLAVVLGPLSDAVAGSPTVVWLAAGLSASVFWSLQVRVYLHLRTSVDAVDATELADAAEPPAEIDRARTTDRAADSKPPPARRGRWGSLILSLALVAGTWLLTAWLFRQAGGDDAGWLGWGLGDKFAPPAEGLYQVASWIALLWGLALFGLPLMIAARPRREKGVPRAVGDESE